MFCTIPSLHIRLRSHPYRKIKQLYDRVSMSVEFRILGMMRRKLFLTRLLIYVRPSKNLGSDDAMSQKAAIGCTRNVLIMWEVISPRRRRLLLGATADLIIVKLLFDRLPIRVRLRSPGRGHAKYASERRGLPFLRTHARAQSDSGRCITFDLGVTQRPRN